MRRPRFVRTPRIMPYDGVGRALGHAYPADRQAPLPRDMARLLDRLDRPAREDPAPDPHADRPERP